MRNFKVFYRTAVGLILGLGWSLSAMAEPFSTVTEQKIAVPSYFYPGGGWNQLRQGAPTVGLAIINPNSGPGTQQDANYVHEVDASKASGVRVLGYVATGYGTRSQAAIKADIAKYLRWYAVDGIFLDEAPYSCLRKPYYQSLYRHIKAAQPDATVVINPGDVTGECFMQTADIIVNFEGSHAAYQKWQPAGWETRYTADRFWHLVYNTSLVNLSATVGLSKQRHAGWIYVTPDRMNNPWDTLPSRAYWRQEVEQVSQ
jgi:Spherulation-specific family 4